MKTIRQLQAEEQWSFVYNVILLDFLRVLFVYYIIWLMGYLWLSGLVSG